MLRYAHTISSASRWLASRHPMFCDPCTAGPRQFYPLRNNNLLNTVSVTGSILEYALKVSGFEFVFTNANTTDIPNYAQSCIAKIYYRTKTEVFISIEGRDNRLYSNFYNGSSWTGWHSTALRSDLVKKATVTLNLSEAGTAGILSAKLGIVVGVNTNNTNAICDLISIDDQWYVRFREITSDVPITGQVTLDYWYIPAQ